MISLPTHNQEEPPPEYDGDIGSLPAPPLAGWLDLTQQGFATLIHRNMDGDYIWFTDRQCWGHWDAELRLWVIESPRCQIAEQRLAQQLAQEIAYLDTEHLENEDYAKALRQWKKQVKTNAYQINAIQMTQAMPGIARQGIEFDRLPLIATPTCAFQLPSLERRQITREDMISRRLAFDPQTGDYPHWHKFINEICCEDDELILYLQCLAGYLMTPWLNEPSIFLCFGRGGNGKTIFFTILAEMLGGTLTNQSYAHGIGKASIISKANENKDWALPGIEGIRMAIVAETAQSDNLNDGKLKNLTGGDPMEAEIKYGSPFSFNPTAKWIIYSNHRLRIRDTTDGIWRRARHVPFLYQIPDHMKIPKDDLLATLRSELPQITRWAMDGLQKYIEAGQRMPYCRLVDEATIEYRANEDTVGKFIQSPAGFINPQSPPKAKDYFGEFKKWCEEEGIKPFGRHAFDEALPLHGLKVKTKGGGYTYIETEVPQELFGEDDTGNV